MKLTDDEREFIELYRKAKQKNDTDVLIVIYALIGMILNSHGFQPDNSINGFTRGQYKRAIKLLRSVQAHVMREGDPDMAAKCDQTVQYIREHCLNRIKGAA